MTTSLFQRLEKSPPDNLPEPLPSCFHVPLQQYALRQMTEPERALTGNENEKWAEHIVLSYVLGRRGEGLGDATPRLLTPDLIRYLNEVDEPESELPATRFIKLLCARISPFDRMADLRTKESRLRFYLDFAVLHNINFKLPPELFPDFIWNALGEEAPLPKPAGQTFPLSRALAHFWRKAMPQPPFQPEDASARNRFLSEFLQIHAAHGLDPRLITPALTKTTPNIPPIHRFPGAFILSAPPALPAAPTSLNYWVWDDGYVGTHLSHRVNEALKASNMPFAAFMSAAKEKPAPGPINLFVCAPDYLADFMLRGGLPYFEARTNIGICSWDTDRLPNACKIGLDLLDEIWVPSPSQQKLFQAFTKKPVEILPPPINNTAPAAWFTRRMLGMEDHTFLFLQVFDAADSLSRKNIAGAIDAFQHAFTQKEDVRLLIKMRGHARTLSAREEGIWARLKRRVEKDTRILLLHEELNDAEQSALLHFSDAVISLHRASSFGATLLEAASRGKPVMTSACGGPMDYLPENARLAIPVVPASAVFDVSPALDREVGHRWHDPDLAEAAKTMQVLYKSGRSEKPKISLPFDAATCGKKIVARVAALKGRR